ALGAYHFRRQTGRFINVESDRPPTLRQYLKHILPPAFVFTQVLNSSRHAVRYQIGEAAQIGRSYFILQVSTRQLLDMVILIENPTLLPVEAGQLSVVLAKLDVLLVLALSISPFLERPTQAAGLKAASDVDILYPPKSV